MQLGIVKILKKKIKNIKSVVMANMYINKKDREALWESYCVLDEVQSDVVDIEDVERFRKAKERILKIWEKSKNK